MNVYLILQWDYFSNLFPKYLCTWEEKGRRQWENKKGTKPFQWALLYPKILMPIWHKAALVLTAVPAPALFQSKIITKIQRIKEKRLYTRNWCSTIPHIHDTGSGSQQVLNPGHLYLKGPGWQNCSQWLLVSLIPTWLSYIGFYFRYLIRQCWPLSLSPYKRMEHSHIK